MKIVKFKDGKFGIRKGSRWMFGYSFKDLKSSHWWSAGVKWFDDCKGSREEVERVLNSMYDIGEVVK
jgi:hypothetical protein